MFPIVTKKRKSQFDNWQKPEFRGRNVDYKKVLSLISYWHQHLKLKSMCTVFIYSFEISKISRKCQTWLMTSFRFKRNVFQVLEMKQITFLLTFSSQFFQKSFISNFLFYLFLFNSRIDVFFGLKGENNFVKLVKRLIMFTFTNQFFLLLHLSSYAWLAFLTRFSKKTF